MTFVLVKNEERRVMVSPSGMILEYIPEAAPALRTQRMP